MKTLSAGQIAQITNGRIIKGLSDVVADKACYYNESFNMPNMLFFLRFEDSFDIENVKKNIPCIIVLEKNIEQLKVIEGCTLIAVDNIEIAFWGFVYYYRHLFNIPVIAVTGTCGKSTVKEMIKHILKYKFNVVGTQMSANSRAHHFDYLLLINDTVDVAVFETAVGKAGDITNSFKYFKPTIGILTNVGFDHTEGCKTIDNYIKAKEEMIYRMRSDGVLVLNADDENIKSMNLSAFKGKIIYFGIQNFADFKAENIIFSEGGMKFALTHNGKNYDVFVPGYGIHQVYNALAALIAAYEVGIDLEEAVKFLETFKNLPLHIQVNSGIKGSIIVRDNWNTNFTSLKAAIGVLSGISGGRKRIAVIGDMNMLGDMANSIHAKAGEMLLNWGGVDVLVAVGALSAIMVDKAVESGFCGEFYKFCNTEGLYDFLLERLDSNTILLIKSAGYRDNEMLKLALNLVMNPQNTSI